MTKELQNTKKLTEDTKEEHEKSKTITDILEEIKQEMCDEYCKYPTFVLRWRTNANVGECNRT